MLVDSLLLILGLALLIGGGHGLILGAAALAQRLGVSPMIIGLTTVAFGTSAPELAVALFAAFSGSSAIAFGNVVGSNIANVGLLLGMTAIIRPLAVHGQVVTREIPMMLLAGGVTLALGMDTVLGHGPDAIQRGDGAVLVLLFGVFLYYTIGDALRQRRSDPLLVEAKEVLPDEQRLGRSLLFIVIGLVALIAGGRLLVDSGIAMARALAVPEVVIGVTVIAVGTSLPELVTCIIAVRRGMNDLAVGNLVGSNIFNLLLVLGLTSTILPVPVPAAGGIDLIVVTVFGVALLPMTMTNQRSITRPQGVMLVTGYLAYVMWQALR